MVLILNLAEEERHQRANLYAAHQTSIKSDMPSPRDQSLIAPVAVQAEDETPPSIVTPRDAAPSIPTPVAPPTITAVAPNTIPPLVAPFAPPSVFPVAPHTVTPFAPPSVSPVASPSVSPVAPPSVSPVAPHTTTPFAPHAPSVAPPVQSVAPPSVAHPVQPIAPYSIIPVEQNTRSQHALFTSSFDPKFSSLQPNEVGAGVSVSAGFGQVPHTSSAAYDTPPPWYTQALQSCYPTTTSFTGITPSDFDFSGLMNFDTEPSLFNISNSNHNDAFDFTFLAPTTIAPSPTVTPISVTAAPQALPTTMKTSEQLSTVKKTRKRKNTEEENAHCILPEGSHRQRKPRRLADD